MHRAFTWFAGKSAWVLGHPIAFVVACAGTLLWAVTGPLFEYSDTWQLVVNTATTVITFLMLFVLQHSQNRDGVAIQAKLDTLILHSKGPNSLIRAEEKAEAELEKLRPNPSRKRRRKPASV